MRIESGGDATSLLASPLWPEQIPDEVHAAWDRFKTLLLRTKEDWDVWTMWYEAALRGESFGAESEIARATLSDAVWAKGPKSANKELKQLLDFSDESPNIPEQSPGLSFTVQPDGRIGLERSGLASDSELEDIAHFREEITNALDDLISKLEGSNSHVWICGLANRYKETIATKLLSIDQVYANGIRLENARFGLERDISSGEYPELQPEACEALDSVLTLNGLMIASTARGQQLLDRARAYALSDAATTAYKAIAKKFARKVGKSANLFSEEVQYAIEQANEQIGQGTHPQRSTNVAYTANSNLLAKLASVAVIVISPSVASGVSASLPGLALSEATMMIANTAWTFFFSNISLLRELCAVSGSDLSWLRAFLSLIERRKRKPDPSP
ncbi:MAG: hypothetical protein Q8K13_08150 [Parvibaculum sp.]|uniref:hypothetical protein n=1 Tax=Parvibaculum sp. TaxID=2024848 RepID=UPI002730011D|nr:hypothetical protein [Parvibaculum sp.]MDP2149594.1 hypothetical protein [Parvibaculum sp.]